MKSAALSAIIIVGALVFPETSAGMTEQSATRRPSMPFTRSSRSTTAEGVGPIRQVPVGWKIVRDWSRMASSRCPSSEILGQLAEELLGDSVFANVILLGYAWQKGLVPIGEAALKQAVVLNAVAVERNVRAFDLGRVLAETPEAIAPQRPHAPRLSTEDLIEWNAEYLTQYQDAAYAARYRKNVERFGAALPGEAAEELTRLAAKSLFKLMAIKDEYQVARLHTADLAKARLDAEFEPGYGVRYHLAPPLISWKKDARGRPVKRSFGPWLTPVLRLMARARRLRGSVVDPFGHTSERKAECALIAWFETLLETLPRRLPEIGMGTAREVLSSPLEIRGFGTVREAAELKCRERAATLLGVGVV